LQSAAAAAAATTLLCVYVDYMAVGCVLSGATTTTATTTLGLDVLAQLVNHTSLYHKLHTVIIVVILSDVDRRRADDFVELIMNKYLFEINIGFIHVIQQARSEFIARSEFTTRSDVTALLLSLSYLFTIYAEGRTLCFHLCLSVCLSVRPSVRNVNGQ